MSPNLAKACACLLLLLHVVHAAHAQPASPRTAQESLPPGEWLDSRQTESVDHMLAFVGINALIAGASSACEAGRADVIRQCTQLGLMNWHDVSGYDDFAHPKAALALASKVWDSDFKSAHDKQSVLTPALPCAAIVAQAARAPALSICAAQPQAPAGAVPRNNAPPPMRIQ